MPFAEHERVLAALRRAAFVPVPGARHLPQVERADIVAPVIVDFLRDGRLPAGSAFAPPGSVAQ